MKDNKRFFEKRIGNSFHYKNTWMDRYAWKIRTSVFFEQGSIEGRKVLDFGCGDGSWGVEFIKRGAYKVYGVEQSKKLAQNSKITTFNYDLCCPDADVVKLTGFNVVTAITSLNFTKPKKRHALLENLRKCLAYNGQLVVIDYFPDFVPNYQLHKPYKEVWNYARWIRTFEQSGFTLVKEVPVNWVDTTIFHYLGGNVISYLLTLFLDTFFTPFNKPKYRLLVFNKTNDLTQHTVSQRKRKKISQ